MSSTAPRGGKDKAMPPKASSSPVLLSIKRRLAWCLCSDLLSPPLPALKALHFDKDDSEETKQVKKKEYALKKAQIEREQVKREPELLNKLDEVVDRVVLSRSEKPADNEEVWAGGGSLAGEKMSALAGPICDLCGNKEHFIEDLSSGDTVCLGRDGQWSCGKVVQDHKVFEGVEKRNFADEDGKDRHQHGPEADPLMPDSENLRTFIFGTDPLSKELNRVHQRVEDNLSSIGNDERRTRTATRSKQKKTAFDLMSTVCSSLGIHRAVLNKANEEFARYRDVREHVHNFNAVVAACMLLSYEKILAEGGNVEATDAADAGPKSYFGEDKIPFGGGKSAGILESNDISISTLRDTPMGKWDSKDLRYWLTAVLEAKANNCTSDQELKKSIFQIVLSKIMDHVERLRGGQVANPSTSHGDSNSKKRKYPASTPSFFGTTTMSHRNKKFYDGAKVHLSGKLHSNEEKLSINHENSGAYPHSKLNADMKSGQVFMRLNLESLVFGKSKAAFTDEAFLEAVGKVIAIIRGALKTRTLYDSAVKEKVVTEEQESRRHKAESSSRFIALNKSSAGDLVPNSSTEMKVSEGNTIPSVGSHDEGDTADDMLLEMLSSNQSGSSIENQDTSASASSAGDQYDVYDAMRREERNRAATMKFRIRK